MTSSCLSNEMLKQLAENGSAGEDAQDQWNHLLQCQSCQNHFQALAGPIPFGAAHIWGAAIACFSFSYEAPFIQVKQLRSSLKEKGFTLSPPDSEIIWAAKDVSSGKEKGDAVDATRLMDAIREVRTALPPTSEIGGFVNAGRGTIGKSGLIGEVGARAERGFEHMSHTFLPGQLLLSLNVSERLQGTGFAMKEVPQDLRQNDVAFLCPAESSTAVTSTESWWASWGGILSHLPISKPSFSVAAIRMGQVAEAATTPVSWPARIAPLDTRDLAPPPILSDKPGREHPIRPSRAWRLHSGECLRIEYQIPQEASVKLLLQRSDGWTHQNPYEIRGIGSPTERALAVRCPETPEPVHVWLLASTGPAEGLGGVLNDLPPLLESINDVPMTLGERLLSLPSLGGFLLLDIGTVVREEQ